jgi:acyl-CoA synthetase (AMP-forming)/AMP-acid ligase II
VGDGSTKEAGTGGAPVALLVDQLRAMAEAFGDEEGFVEVGTGAALTFATWEGRSNAVARGLVDAGVVRGDRVAIHLPPEESLAWVVAYAGIHKAGAAAVATNTRMVPRELGYILGHAEVRAAFVGRSGAENLLEIRGDLPTLRTVVTTGATAPGLTPWADLAAGDDSAFQVPVDGDDLAELMYTSGTTGLPKGVVVRHRAAATMPNSEPAWRGGGWLHASPLFTFAGITSIYNPMKLGMPSLYMPRFDAEDWLDAVERHRPTRVFLVPAMVELLVARPRFADADLSSIEVCAVGSAPIAPDTLARLRDRLPDARVPNSWGMTEAGPAFCTMPEAEMANRVGSVGRPTPPTEFRIVDDDGHELPAGEVGELLVRNPGREREYYRDPDANAAAWRDGWLHTGDLARLDADGYLYIAGRKKDVIIRGGNNVHAVDIEAVLYEHPDVREAAVAGVAHPVLGEDVHAWVVLGDDATVSSDELREFCADRLTHYKVPREAHVVAELPRNANGKVLKRELVPPTA